MYPQHCCCQRRYGFFDFLCDVLMLALTAGLWSIWMIIREFRYRR